MPRSVASSLMMLLLLASTLAVAFKIQPANADVDSWPMFHHDSMHSGFFSSTGSDTNQTLWNYTTSGPVGSSPAVTGGVVYVGSYDGRVYALNAATGAQIWNYTTGNSVESSPAVAGGVVYVGSDDFNVYALNATTGALIWSYTTGNDVHSSPAVASGVVYVGSYDGKVYALDAATGTQIWNYTTGSAVASSPAVAGGIVYVGSFYNLSVFALNATTGALIWRAPTGNAVFSSPAVAGGVVYLGDYSRNVDAWNATTGALLWFTPIGWLPYGIESSPAVAHGMIYIGSDTGLFCALNATTGALIWAYMTGGAVTSSPAVAGGVVYVGSNDHKVYALNAARGTLIWSYTTSNGVASSPAVAGGVVYVGSNDGNVYAFVPPIIQPLIVSISPTLVAMDVGQSQLFTLLVAGGTSPYTYQWYLNGSAVQGATSSSWTFTATSAGSYTVYVEVTDSVGTQTTSNTASVSSSLPLIEAEISPSNASTSIGGSLSYSVTVSNQGHSSDDVNLSVCGLDVSWYSLEKNQTRIVPGEVSTIQLDVTVPENPENVGLHVFNVTVSDQYTQQILYANLTILMNPIMYDLEPNANTTIGSTSLIVLWRTSSNASSEVYIKCLNDSTSSLVVGAWGTDHSVYVGNLSRNTAYVWYARSATAYGEVDSDNMSLNVSNGIGFTQSVYTFNVERNYAQQASVSIINTDTESHDLLLEALNPYQDLIVGFVGPGSVDENLTVASGETISVAFNIFAQDAMQQNYTFALKLTNLGAEQITGYAMVNVNVRQPNLNLTLTEESTDPVTLSKNITATNYGDPITDLYIRTSDELVGKVSFEPTVCHANLPAGGSLTFQAVPVLTTDFTGIEGLVTATGAGQVIATLPVNFTLPPGKSVYSVTIPQVSIGFDKYYDTDNSPNTNPLPGQPVESYLANGTLIFASQIIVDVYQNNTPASGANVSLTLWNSTGAVTSLDYSMTDFTGKALFDVVGPAGNYSYQAELIGYGLKTETRSFSVSTSCLYEIRPNDISWLDVSDANLTYNLTEGISTVTLNQAPFTFRATKATTGENATFFLALRWNLDVHKYVYILGSIQNSTLTFQTSGIPVGNFTAAIYYYSPDTGLSLTTPLNVVNTDSKSMYTQGNYTYYTPFPFNSTDFIKLVTERSASTRDPTVAFDLVNIEPSDPTNSFYQLEYVIVSNETIQKDFQFYLNTTEGELYNTTFHLDLESANPVKVNFTVPVELLNGTLQGEFDAKLSTDVASITSKSLPQLSYLYDSRIWVGSQNGILDPILWSIAPWYEFSQLPNSWQKEVVTCGAFLMIGQISEIGGLVLGGVKGYMDFTSQADNIDKAIIIGKYVTGGVVGTALILTGATEAVIGATGAVLIIGSIAKCVYDAYRAVAPAQDLSTPMCVCKLTKTGMWYCTNRQVVSAQVPIDPSPADVVQAAAVVKFSLPWPMFTYRPHNVHLFINSVEIGNLTNTIPEGYYVFPFNSSLLNYAANGPSENTVTMKMDDLNGGHYVVTSDWEIILQLKQLALSVVASNQTEAESLVEQLTGAVASMADFKVSPNLAFSTSEPRESQSITIAANVLNLGTAGMSYVPVDLYVDSHKVESAIISFLPEFANQTVDFSWTATRGTHNMTVVVNGDWLIPESDYSNNQAQTSITVLGDDVAVTNVTVSSGLVQQGFPLAMNVTAANKGDFTEAFNVTVYANSTSIGWQTITLASGASATIVLTWITTISDFGNYTISAYATPVANEIETADNTFIFGTVQIVQATNGGCGGRMPYMN